MKKLDLRKSEDSSPPPRRLNKVNLKERRKESEANILDIVKKDFRSSLTNPIVIIVMLGIIMLPSLYALINIYACWDPYENTGNVEFAIANEDLGAEYNGERVDVGAKLIESLKDNHDFKWVFISSDELRRGVHNGTYYAGMVIPKNFSESVVSITSGKPHSAELEYIVNQKTSPVGAKLTDAASKAVYNKLNAEIVSFIDVAALEKLGQLQDGLATGADKMEDGADQLSAGADKVASGADQLTSGANKVSSGSDQLASGAKTLSSGATALSVGSVELANGADQVASGASQVADGTQQIASKTNELYDIYSKIKQVINKGGNASNIADDVDKLDSESSKISEELDQLYYDTLHLTNDSLDLYSESYNLTGNSANLLVNSSNLSVRTNKIVNQFNNLSDDISRLNEAIKNGEDPSVINNLLNELDKKITSAHDNINDLNDGAHLVSDGSSAVSSGAYQLADGSQQLADGSNQLASGASELSSGVHVLANGTIELASGAELLGYSSASALRNASDEIGFAAEQLSAVTDINQEEAGDYFFSPVILKRHEEFPTSNYGSQVSPFYIVLSMWVGALITSVMLKTGTSIGTSYKPHEMYLGKLVMFNVMAILETTVTLIGVFILGLDVGNILMFIFSCYFVAVVFMTIIYSLISLLGDVGKAIAILLLVFQISGSGGIYPVEIMNVIFGIIYPYLPMTHGINIVREAQLGLIWTNYMPSFIILFFMGAIVIILSILLKQRWDKRTKFFDEKLEEADIFN